MKKPLRVTLTGLGVIALVAAGGLTGTAIASATAPGQPEGDFATSVKPVDQFDTNSDGLTLGYVDQGLATDPSARADLVAVATDDGKDGWAYTAELMPWLAAKTPEEATALSTTKAYAVAVYESDGKTRIGTHTVNRDAK